MSLVEVGTLFPLCHTLLTTYKYFLRLLNSSSSKEYTASFLHSWSFCLSRCTSSLVFYHHSKYYYRIHIAPPSYSKLYPSQISALYQLSSMSPPDALALPLLGALCTPLPTPRPAPDLDAPVFSIPSIPSDSSCFSSTCTSSPAQTCMVGCHTITTLSSDVLTAVQCSPAPGAQQKSEGRAV